MSEFHTPVLLREVLEALKIEKGRKYIDGTLGGGGHSFEIVKRGGNVLGIDVDQDAIDYVSELRIGKEIIVTRGNFKDIGEIAHSKGFEQVSGILFDLGVSSHQLGTAEKGFSFLHEGPLDMRMDQDLVVKAEDLINGLSQKELYELFSKLGEERFAHAISYSIAKSRRVKKILSTGELSKLARRVAGNASSAIHPATKIFQALRMAVNTELENLYEGIVQGVTLLEKGGRFLIISFHSLEDRIVKNSFREMEQKGVGIVITKKPIVPSEEEVLANPRSRSAKLRVFEKS